MRNHRVSYSRATRDEPTLGISGGARPEPTLDEARAELSEVIIRVATPLFKDKYGPLLGIIPQPAINEILKSFEATVSRAKGDLTLVVEELLNRVISKTKKVEIGE